MGWLGAGTENPSGQWATGSSIPVYTIAMEVIDIWYGPRQTFGLFGCPQRWVNILGRYRGPRPAVMVFSLNSGAERPLSLGPDRRRLVGLGDFNVELDFDELLDGDNDLRISARSQGGEEYSASVIVVKCLGKVPSLPFTITWDEPGPSRNFQIVDGSWNFANGCAVVSEIGYDRLIALGDVSWRNYRVTVPFQVHSINPRAYATPSVHTGVGVVVGWLGHSTWIPDADASGQPRFGPGPYGAIGWHTTWIDNDPNVNLFDGDFNRMVESAYQVRPDVWYRLCVQSACRNSERPVFSLKIWRDDETEPEAWTIERRAPLNALGSGGVLLGAHETAARFGPVLVEEAH
jgi:hypothetical protein